jgi:phage anti-repressor protein
MEENLRRSWLGVCAFYLDMKRSKYYRCIHRKLFKDKPTIVFSLQMSSLIQRLQPFFSNNEEKVFFDNFSDYIHVNPYSECIINIADHLNLFGLCKKESAVRVLQNYSFMEGVDYVYEIVPQKTGRPIKAVKISVNTFRDLCLIAKTPESLQFRNFVLKLEKLISEMSIKHKNDDVSVSDGWIEEDFSTLFQNSRPHVNVQAQATQTDIEEIVDQRVKCLEDKIKALQQELHMYKPKTRIPFENGESVYVVMEFDVGLNQRVFKVGRTIQRNNRFEAYSVHSSQNDIVYSKRCQNCKLLESTIHHMFKDYKLRQKEDWYFGLDFYDLKDAIDIQQSILDGGSVGESYINDDVVGPRRSECKYKAPNVLVTPNSEPQTQKCDIDEFLRDCFEHDPNAKSSWVDITARYRLWARDLQVDKRKVEMKNFLRARKFKEVKLFDPITGGTLQAYQGLKLKPIPPITLPPTPSLFDRFIYDTMTTTFTARIIMEDVFSAYCDWKDEHYPEHDPIKQPERDRLVSYFSERFLGSIVHNGQKRRIGFYGICLKGDEISGKKTKNGNRRPVAVYSEETKKLIGMYESRDMAGKQTGTNVYNVSARITSKKPWNGYYYRNISKAEHSQLMDNLLDDNSTNPLATWDPDY